MRRRHKKLKPNQKPDNEAFFKPSIQTKLNIGKSNDIYEVEADKMADQVVNKVEGQGAVQKMEGTEDELQQKPLASTVTPLVQRMESSDEEQAVQKMTDEEPQDVQQMSEEEESVQQMSEEEESVQQMVEEEEVQTKANNPNTSAPIETRLKKNKGKGNPISKGIKNEMESGFGTDFSNVNIHTDNEAVQMSEELGAQAFTHRDDVYFNKGKYNPTSKEGKHLLAHELTHTIQQNRGLNGTIQQQKKPKKVGSKKLFKKALKKIKKINPKMHAFLTKATLGGGSVLIRIEKGNLVEHKFSLDLKTVAFSRSTKAEFQEGNLDIDKSVTPVELKADMIININSSILQDKNTPDNIEKYAEYLYHESIHMILYMERIIAIDPPTGHKKSPFQLEFEKYMTIALGHADFNTLKTNIEKLLNSETSLTIPTAKIPSASSELIENVVEEKYIFDQTKKQFTLTASNKQLAFSYFLERLQKIGSKVQLGDSAFNNIATMMTTILNDIDAKTATKTKPKSSPKKSVK